MSAINVNAENWDKEIAKANSLVLVDFWAPWCPWCRRLMPDFDSLASEYGNRMKFAKVNADDNPDIASKYGVQGLPTLKFFCQGRPVGEIVGYLPKPRLKAEIDKTMLVYRDCIEQSSPIKQ